MSAAVRWWLSGLALVLFCLTSPARAALPETVAVPQIEDRTGTFTPEALERLSVHLRARMAMSGVHVLAVAGSVDTIRYVSEVALITTLGREGGRLSIVSELRDLARATVLARGRGTFEAVPAPLMEARTREALSDVADQIKGAVPEGQLREVPPDALKPEPPQAPPVSDPVEPVPPEVPEPPEEPSPAPNRYAAQLGVENAADTFVGLGQFSILHNRSRDFVGLLALSGWRNTAGGFDGALQLGLRANEAGSFHGLGQLSLVSNTAGEFMGLGQVGIHNSADSFYGLGQLGLLNETEEIEHQGSGRSRFVGLAQLGLANSVRRDFYAPLQLGFVNLGGRADAGIGLQLGAFNMMREGGFSAAVQAGVVSLVQRDFDGILQVGALVGTWRTFSGIAQVGVVSYVGNNLYREIFSVDIDNGDNRKEDFRGVLQAGVVTLTDDDFHGVLQGGLGNLVGGSFQGLAQVGAANFIEHEFRGFLQAGALNLVDDFTGFAQIGALSYASRAVHGGQLGLFNLAKRTFGLQLGLVNRTGRLRGVQLGLVNLSEDGGLPVTGILNLGF